MGQADGICPHLTDQLHILLMVCPGKRISLSGTILMPGYAAKRITLPVQDKASLRIYLKAAAAEPDVSLIQLSLPVRKQSLKRIQMRVLSAVPQMRFLNMQRGGRRPCFGLCLRYLLLTVPDREPQSLAPCGSGKPCLHGNLRILPLHHRRHRNAGAAEMIQVKPCPVHAQQGDIPIDSAVKGKICHLRIDMIVGPVVCRHQNLVLLL